MSSVIWVQLKYLVDPPGEPKGVEIAKYDRNSVNLEMEASRRWWLQSNLIYQICKCQMLNQ